MNFKFLLGLNINYNKNNFKSIVLVNNFIFY